jgi:hypothetical protein
MGCGASKSPQIANEPKSENVRRTRTAERIVETLKRAKGEVDKNGNILTLEKYVISLL